MSATIHFFIRTDRPFRDKSAPVYILFTINSKLKTKLSLGKRVSIKKEFKNLSVEEIIKMPPDLRAELYNWDEGAERAIKPDPHYEKLNIFLDDEKKRANDIILKLERLGEPVTIDAFKKNFCKSGGNFKFVEYFLNELQYHTGRWSKETIRGLKSKIRKVGRFRPNLTLNGVTYKFLNQYEAWLKKPKNNDENRNGDLTAGESNSKKSSQEIGCGNSDLTIASNMRVIRTLINIAIKNGDFIKELYPFKDYKIDNSDYELTSRDYLEPEELASLERLFDNYIPLPKPQHEMREADWNERTEKGIITPGEFKTLRRFLGACYTGLRFKDTCVLDRHLHLFSKNIDVPSGQRISRFYIEIKMHKTSSPVMIPLIDRAIPIFEPEKKEGNVFEPLSHKTITEHLKSIQKKAGLTKHITFHVARHTFATICFIYGIPILIAQKLLGHKNRKFTEIYTHLATYMLFLEMDKINSGMNKITKKDLAPATVEAKILQLLPDLEKLDAEKLEQIMSLVKILAKSA